MGFLDMGIGEILLVIVVALIIWGPGRLPEIARTMGKAVSTLRRTSSELTTQIRKELEEEADHPTQSMLNRNDKTGESPEVDTPEAGDATEPNPEDR